MMMTTTTTSTTTTTLFHGICHKLIIGTCHNTEKCGIKLFVFYFMMLLVTWITQWKSSSNQDLTQALNCRNGMLQLTSEPGTCQIQVRSITT